MYTPSLGLKGQSNLVHTRADEVHAIGMKNVYSIHKPIADTEEGQLELNKKACMQAYVMMNVYQYTY